MLRVKRIKFEACFVSYGKVKKRLNIICNSLVTHEHSDAILGIDDLREAQAWNARLPMYMSERAYVHVKETFDYLFNSDPEYLPGVPKSIPVAKNRLAAASFTAVVKTVIIAQPELKEAESPRAFDIQGVRVVSFPVIHGANNLSLGFVFGRSESKFVYISDIIELPRASEDYLKSLKIEILMVDAIHRTDDMDYAHQSVMSAIKMGLRLRAEKVFLTGMGHTIVYEDLSAELPEMVRMAKAAAKSQQDIQVVASHDGMVVSLKGIDL